MIKYVYLSSVNDIWYLLIAHVKCWPDVFGNTQHYIILVKQLSVYIPNCRQGNHLLRIPKVCSIVTHVRHRALLNFSSALFHGAR